MFVILAEPKYGQVERYYQVIIKIKCSCQNIRSFGPANPLLHNLVVVYNHIHNVLIHK